MLNLNGGDAALFKFNTGAPVVSRVPAQPAQLTPQRQTNNAAISIQGTVGALYRVESASAVASPNWTVATNLVLPASPFQFTESLSEAQRYYRVIGAP